MKFSEMKYTRPDAEAVKAKIASLTERLAAAASYEEAREVFLEMDNEKRHFMTASELAGIRHMIDTRDEFYDAETQFLNNVGPEIQAPMQEFSLALVQSPFRPQFEEEFGSIMFLNTEIALKTFSPEIIPYLQEEAQLQQEYDKLIASAKVNFEGGVYTLSQMTPFKTDPDDDRRLAAWKAEGAWFKENQAALDEIYDKLVHLRDKMGKALGYADFTQLGYYRMNRNCYTKEDIEAFREAVRKYLVPVAEEIYKHQAQRLGKSYPLSYADAALEFRSGNPRPVGTAQDILAQGKKFYEELSPETAEFFNHMLDKELMDVLSTEGKAAGGFCTAIPDYEAPFIFANFNGTQGDVEVVTHEAGHAFAVWMNRSIIPMDIVFPTTEACEVHSMSMEFMSWPWAEGFFGKDTRKFLFSHLSGAITFIPYGTMVDHYQHIVYEKPEMTPAQRHGVWKELLGIYMPWLKLDGDIPFYSDGEGWQKQLHIYDVPFYYIDYCLAQTMALQFWAMIQHDQKQAWDTYMKYTVLGGSRTFTELIAAAGLKSPFGDEALRSVCAEAKTWLENFSLEGIV